MTQLLFRNRWLAAIWVVVSLFSVGAYFSEGGGQERIAKASADIRAQKVELLQPAAQPAHRTKGFTADEELIDKTGEDDPEDKAKAAAAAAAAATAGDIAADPTVPVKPTPDGQAVKDQP